MFFFEYRSNADRDTSVSSMAPSFGTNVSSKESNDISMAPSEGSGSKLSKESSVGSKIASDDSVNGSNIASVGAAAQVSVAANARYDNPYAF